MNSTQTRHTVPLVQGDKLLVGTGAEKTAVKFMGKDFVFNAKENGVIEELDEKSGIMIVKYDTGEKEAYDFSTILCKNGGGGYMKMLKFQHLQEVRIKYL